MAVATGLKITKMVVDLIAKIPYGGLKIDQGINPPPKVEISRSDDTLTAELIGEGRYEKEKYIKEWRWEKEEGEEWLKIGDGKTYTLNEIERKKPIRIKVTFYDIGRSLSGGYVIQYAGPIILRTKVTQDNSSITVTFSKSVYSADNGSGALETSDFELSITNGAATNATISGATKTDGNPLDGRETAIKLNLTITGTPDGEESVTIAPVKDSIYDAEGNAASNSQSNNTVRLNDKTAPTISNTEIATDNSAITVTFSEPVYSADNGSGALLTSDFKLSITNGIATVNPTPSTISSSENAYTLGLSLTGTPDGNETLTVNPSSATAIYDKAGNAADASQSSNTVKLNDKTAPNLPSNKIQVNNTVQPNTVTLTFSEALNEAAAKNNDNYIVKNNNASITYSIESASLDDTGKTVKLTLDGANPSNTATYITNEDARAGLKVTPSASITDLAGNHYGTDDNNPNGKDVEVTESGATHELDTTTPTATISGAPPSSTNDTTATLTVGGAGVAHYKYKLDSASYSDETPIGNQIVLNDLEVGERAVYVIGADYAGNWQEEPTAATWTIAQ